MDFPSSSNSAPNAYEKSARITLTSGNNAKGSYATLLTTTRKSRWIQIELSDINDPGFWYYVDISTGATPRIIIPDIFCLTTSPVLNDTDLGSRVIFSGPIEIPAGLAVKARLMVDARNAKTGVVVAHCGYR